jgi:hypothetical protein
MNVITITVGKMSTINNNENIASVIPKPVFRKTMYYFFIASAKVSIDIFYE